MPLYAASISEMITMPVGVLTADYIDVWCNTATVTQRDPLFRVKLGLHYRDLELFPRRRFIADLP